MAMTHINVSLLRRSMIIEKRDMVLRKAKASGPPPTPAESPPGRPAGSASPLSVSASGKEISALTPGPTLDTPHVQCTSPPPGSAARARIGAS